LPQHRWRWDRAQRDLDFVRLDHESFEQAPARSVDYAIMEHSSRIAVLAADIRWWDLGNWKSVHAASSCDDNGNAVIGAGHFHEAKGNLIYARDRTAAVVGLDNIALVCTPDAVLAASLHSSEGLKQFVQHLEQIDPDAVTNNLRVHRPWGDYQQIDRGHGYLVKRITVKPHRKLSLQSHEHRAEHWVVVSGTAIVTLDDRELRLEANQSIYVPLGSVHRLANPTDTDLRLIEVQTGEILDEEDITRYEDVYNRV
jgi:mannose-1-phosphate guanylyltransferase/mannose-6-phosphate isomerase